MSILFLPPQSAGSITIADATETTSGKIRIATSAEATAGTNDVTAMTPAKVKSVVDASVVGGVTYQGTFDASTPADLSNATKGDLYIISVAGTYAGKTWAVGDHLLVNADMGGTLDSAKIDKVDNTDAVTSVAGRTGAITLSTADVSGLATVASTGAYSDLSGTPTLGTAAALDVGTGASNVVQLDGTGKLPAIDGSQLTNLPSSSLALDDLTDVTITSASTGEVLRYDGSEWVDAQLAYSDLSGTPTLATVATTGAYSDLSGTPTNVSTFTNDAGYLTDISAENIGDLADVDLTGLADGEILIYNSTSGNWESNPPPAPLATTTSVGLIEIATNAEAIAGTEADKALVPSNISSITTAQLDNSAGTMLEAANNLSDVVNAATARTNLGLGTASIEDVGTSAGNVVQLDGSARLPAVDGSQLTNLAAPTIALNNLTDVTIAAAATGEVLRYNGSVWVDAQLAYSDLSGTPTLGTAAAEDVGTSAGNVVQLDGSARLPAVDGSQLTGITADVSTASLGDLSDVDLTTSAPTNGNFLKYDGTNWVPADVGKPSISTSETASTPSGSEQVYILTPATNITFSLQGAATCGAGFRYVIKNMSANTITVDPNGAETIDGQSSFSLDIQYGTLTVITDGSNWFIV